MKSRLRLSKGQASVEYVLILVGCSLAVAAGMALFSAGLDSWWMDVVAQFSKAGP